MRGFSVIGKKKQSGRKFIESTDRKNAVFERKKINYIIRILPRGGTSDAARFVQEEIYVIPLKMNRLAPDEQLLPQGYLLAGNRDFSVDGYLARRDHLIRFSSRANARGGNISIDSHFVFIIFVGCIHHER